MDPQPDDPTPERRGPGGRSAPARGAVRGPASPAPVKKPANAASQKTNATSQKTDATSQKNGTATKKPASPTRKAPSVSRKSTPSTKKAAPQTPVPDATPVIEPDAKTPGVPKIARQPVAPARVRPTRAPAPLSTEIALSVERLSKSFGGAVAVDEIDLEARAGSLFGFVGPNGAGKTTTLAMVTGLLRPDAGAVTIYGADVWTNPTVAKRSLGVLPDRLRLFDRLTGAEYLYHAGALRGLDRETITRRSDDLIAAFGLQQASHRFVSDFSAGMVKKIAIAAAMIHSPRLLVLDEPFESVDPVSAQLVIDILKNFASAGGTVLLSSHSMDLIERVCDSVAIIAGGRILATGPLETVLKGRSLEDRFVELAGGATAVEGMEWLQSFSD